MPYTWTNFSASSASVVYPQWTITSGTTTASGGTYTLEPGWQWGWDQPVQPHSLQQPYDPPSREELDRIAAEQDRRQRERETARARITERAEALLRGLLDEEQIASYFSQGWFEVTGSAGGRYRIRRNGQAGNVDEMPPAGDERVASLCIHPYGGFHDADAHAAQYLALVTDEPGFRRTANRTPRRRLPAAA